MSDESEGREQARKVIAATNRISVWLTQAGVTDTDRRVTLAVGLADLISAAQVVETQLNEMLSEDVRDPAAADRALANACAISAWLFTELKDHLLELEEIWEPEVETRLAALGTPDATEDT